MLQMWMNIIGYVHSLRHSWTLLKIKRNLLKIQVINNEEIYYSFYLVGMSGGLVSAQDYVSKVWVSDQGDGTYKIQYFMRIILILTPVGLEMIII